MIQKQFPEFHLEDQVNVWAGVNDRPQIYFTYSRTKGNMGKTQVCRLKCNSVGSGFIILLWGCEKVIIGSMWVVLEALIDLLSFAIWESFKSLPLECLVFYRIVPNFAE